MGSEVFQFYYEYLFKARTNPGTDESKLRKELDHMIGGNKELKNLIFVLEQLIFREV